MEDNSDSLEYGLTRLVLGCPHFVELSKDEFDEIISAKKQLVIAMSVEQKLDLLLGNFQDFESELLNLTLKSVIYPVTTRTNGLQNNTSVNRKLFNFLAASRLYTDQVKHDVSNYFGNNSIENEEIKKLFSEEYDSCLGYRFVDAIRNHIQHRSLPIYELHHNSQHELHHNSQHELHHNSRRETMDSPIEFTLIPMIKMSRLKEEGKFKSSVLKELEQIGDLVDIRPLVREHVGSISRVHQKLRELLKSDLKKSEIFFRQTIERYRKTEDCVLALAIVSRFKSGKIKEKIEIHDGMIIRRKELEEKLGTLTHLPKSYVSGRTEPISSQK